MGGINTGLEKVAQWRARWFLVYTEYYSSDEIKKDQIGGACGFYDVGERST